MSRAPSPSLGRRTIRAMDAEEREEERRAAREALTYGVCFTCRVDVGPDGIHAWDCTFVPTERRANRGRP